MSYTAVLLEIQIKKGVVQTVTELSPETLADSDEIILDNGNPKHWEIKTHMHLPSGNGYANFAIKTNDPSLSFRFVRGERNDGVLSKVGEFMAGAVSSGAKPMPHKSVQPSNPVQKIIQPPVYETLEQFSRDGLTYHFFAAVKDNTAYADYLPGIIGSAGYVSLEVMRNGEKAGEEKLIIKPSISRKEYSRMIEDIGQLNYELLDQSGSLARLGFEQDYEGVNRKYRELKEILKKIEKEPDHDLTSVTEKVRTEKIKKYSAKTLADLSAGRQKARTTKHKESLDIYEHRILFAYLGRLKELAENLKKKEINEKRVMLGSAENDIDGTWGNEEECKRELKRRHDEISRKLTFPGLDEDSDLCHRVFFSLTGAPMNYFTFDNSLSFSVKNSDCFCFGPGNWTDGITVSGVWLNKEITYRDEAGEEEKTATLRTRFVTELRAQPGDDALSMLFFYDCMKALSDLYHTLGNNRADLEFDYNGKLNLPVRRRGDDMFCSFYADIGRLNSLKIIIRNGLQENLAPDFIPGAVIQREGVISVSREDYARKIREKYSEGELKERLIRLILEKDEEYNKQKFRLKKTEINSALLESSEKWDSLIRDMEKLRSCRVFKDITKRREHFHSSNLFTIHPVYKKAYKSMRSLMNFSTPGYNDGNGFAVGMVRYIYEVWCLVRMLTTFIKVYGLSYMGSDTAYADTDFSCRENTDVRENINRLIADVEKCLKGGCELNGRCFYLKGEVGRSKIPVEIALNYDAEIGGKRPDFRLKVTVNGKTLFFCLDAKYRNYVDMTAGKWFEDIKTVAWDKYIVHLNRCNNTAGEPHSLKETEATAASFILHSDTELGSLSTGKLTGNENNTEEPAGKIRKELNKSRGNFLGFKEPVLKAFSQTYPVEVNEETCLPGKGNLLPGEIYDWKTLSGRIGSIPFMPSSENGNSSDSGFRALFQMIMEHYFGIYDEVCFMCGEPVKAENIRLNRTGNGYHIHCERCGEFWVSTHCSNRNCRRSLGKHYRDYYDGDRWNVVCPDCGNKASNREE